MQMNRTKRSLKSTYKGTRRVLCSEVPYYLSDLTQALAEDMGAKVIGHLTRGHGSLDKYHVSIVAPFCDTTFAARTFPRSIHF